MLILISVITRIIFVNEARAFTGKTTLKKKENSCSTYFLQNFIE